MGLGWIGDANVYVAGWFDGVNDFGGARLTSRGGQDVFLARYDIAVVLLTWGTSGRRRFRAAETPPWPSRWMRNRHAYVTGALRDGRLGLLTLAAADGEALFPGEVRRHGIEEWVSQADGPPGEECRGQALASMPMAAAMSWALLAAPR